MPYQFVSVSSTDLSQNDEPNLKQNFKAKPRFIALFYASWCMFSREFFACLTKNTLNSPVPCLRVMVDDRKDLCEKYGINFCPAVSFF